MHSKRLVIVLKRFLKIEKDKLVKINTSLRSEKIDIKNRRYFRKLSKASKISHKIQVLQSQLSMVRRARIKFSIVTMRSKVKLVSTKIGAIVWVDAKNYLELLGRNVGDIVLMNNSHFLIAGIS